MWYHREVGVLAQSIVHDVEVVSLNQNVTANRVDDIDKPSSARVIGESIECRTNIKYLKVKFGDGEEAYVCDGVVS